MVFDTVQREFDFNGQLQFHAMKRMILAKSDSIFIFFSSNSMSSVCACAFFFLFLVFVQRQIVLKCSLINGFIVFYFFALFVDVFVFFVRLDCFFFGSCLDCIFVCQYYYYETFSTIYIAQHLFIIVERMFSLLLSRFVGNDPTGKILIIFKRVCFFFLHFLLFMFIRLKPIIPIFIVISFFFTSVDRFYMHLYNGCSVSNDL